MFESYTAFEEALQKFLEDLGASVIGGNLQQADAKVLQSMFYDMHHFILLNYKNVYAPWPLPDRHKSGAITFGWYIKPPLLDLVYQLDKPFSTDSIVLAELPLVDSERATIYCNTLDQARRWAHWLQKLEELGPHQLLP